MELVLRESRRIVRTAKDVLIIEHRLGLIMANAGIDQSNVAEPAKASLRCCCRKIRMQRRPAYASGCGQRSGCAPAVIISDSFGRPWRLGTVGVAIGCAGSGALRDLRGSTDMFGRACASPSWARR